MRHFWGYPRTTGGTGTRNLVAVIPTVFCANHVAQRIASSVRGAVALPHPVGCGYPGPDQSLSAVMLRQMALHPNYGAVLLVGLGCERITCENLLHDMTGAQKPVESIKIQDVGGSTQAIARGASMAQSMAQALSKQQREQLSVEHLTLGLKCGGTDAASGMAANPALGIASDLLVSQGGTSILTEITELMGAEHIMARRAASPYVAAKILEIVQRNTELLRSAMQATPSTHNAHMLVSPGNSDGGVTNVVEKALGGLKKAGKAPFAGVLNYATPPQGNGLYLMDGPGHDAEAVSGLVGAGANVVVFTTGRGTPTGFPGVPVIKITGTPTTWAHMRDNLDFDASHVITKGAALSDVGADLFDLILRVASGETTCAETLGHEELFVISRLMATRQYLTSCSCES